MRKVVDDRFYLSRAKGGGILRREIWSDDHGRVVRYNLAYINPLLSSRDNGRVLGYDGAHGVHRRHWMGRTTPVAFESFADIESQFQAEWQDLTKQVTDAEDRDSS